MPIVIGARVGAIIGRCQAVVRDSALVNEP